MLHLQPLHATGILAVVLLASATLPGCGSDQVGKMPTGPVAPTQPPSLFEQATQGFTTCDLGDLFVDEYTNTTSNPYLLTIEDRRCDVSETLVTYCIDEQFHGLDVTRLAVPSTTLPVFALYFDADLEEGRSTLMARLGKDFRESTNSRLGVEPELVQDPADDSASILICTKPD